MAQITTKDIISFLKQMRRVDLTDEIKNANITVKQEEMVKDSLKKTQSRIPKVIKLLKNLQPKLTEKALKNLLRFLRTWPYTSPLACGLKKQPKITPHHHI